MNILDVLADEAVVEFWEKLFSKNFPSVYLRRRSQMQITCILTVMCSIEKATENVVYFQVTTSINLRLPCSDIQML